MILTHESTFLMCWQQWPWYHQERSNRMTGRAHIHWRAQNHHQFQRRWWQAAGFSFVRQLPTGARLLRWATENVVDNKQPPLPPPRKPKRKLSISMTFPKIGGVLQHIFEACGIVLTEGKNISECQRLSWNWIKTIDCFNFISKFLLLFSNNKPFSSNRYLWYTYYFRVLIQTGTEPLGYKRISKYSHYFTFNSKGVFLL